jgi:2-polyprenyl-3-methyl-5-hydroxy-6-metoxy-1,4-benzoquinol methylase
MNNSIGATSTDPVGTETLDYISEAETFNNWMYSVISPALKGKILEIGSGIGNISDFLIKDKDNVTLSDLRSEYCEYLSTHFKDSKSLVSVEQIDLSDNDFEKKYKSILNSFDTVFSLNVIEHIENDSLAVQNCTKLLREGGTLVILVPSYQWLYCRFDKELGHFRRYNRKSLLMLVKSNGLSVLDTFNFNATGVFGWLLFGKLLKHKQIKQGQMKLYNKLVFIFKLIDKLMFRRFGLSLIIIARK